jgi:hypothetical protein
MIPMQQELPLQVAKKRGVMAAQACADAAERRNPGWVDAAYTAFVAYAQIKGSAPFTVEDVRVNAASVPPAPDARAWGSVAMRLKREGIIVACGYRGVESSNGSPKTLWKFNSKSK